MTSFFLVLKTTYIRFSAYIFSFLKAIDLPPLLGQLIEHMRRYLGIYLRRTQVIVAQHLLNNQHSVGVLLPHI